MCTQRCIIRTNLEFLKRYPGYLQNIHMHSLARLVWGFSGSSRLYTQSVCAIKCRMVCFYFYILSYQSLHNLHLVAFSSRCAWNHKCMYFATSLGMLGVRLLNMYVQPSLRFFHLSYTADKRSSTMLIIHTLSYYEGSKGSQEMQNIIEHIMKVYIERTLQESTNASQLPFKPEFRHY